MRWYDLHGRCSTLYCVFCLLVHSWVPTSFVGPLLQCSSRFPCSWTVFLYNMVLWVSAVQALSAYCRRHDTLEPSGTDPRGERDLGLSKRPAHSRCRGIEDRCMNQANMVTREGSGLQADRHPTRLAMTVISWGAIVLTGLMVCRALTRGALWSMLPPGPGRHFGPRTRLRS